MKEIGLEDVYLYQTNLFVLIVLNALKNDAVTARCEGDQIRGCVSISD